MTDLKTLMGRRLDVRQGDIIYFVLLTLTTMTTNASEDYCENLAANNDPRAGPNIGINPEIGEHDNDSINDSSEENEKNSRKMDDISLTDTDKEA